MRWASPAAGTSKPSSEPSSSARSASATSPKSASLLDGPNWQDSSGASGLRSGPLQLVARGR